MGDNISNIQNIDNIPNIYCINVKSSTVRRERMIHRFKTARLLDKVTFIDAIPSGSSLIDHYIGYIDGIKEDEKINRNVVSCRISHLKAIEQFLIDTPSNYYNIDKNNNNNYKYAIICEDDIMLDNNFIDKYNDLMKNVPDDAPVVCLSYLMWYYDDIRWSGRDYKIENICNIGEDTWGTQMYLISKDYAMKSLNKYNKLDNILKEGYKDSGEIITSELITRLSGGYIAYPPLAIEDCICSVIDYKEGENSNHIEAIEGFGYYNYNNGELEDLSPLSTI